VRRPALSRYIRRRGGLARKRVHGEVLLRSPFGFAWSAWLPQSGLLTQSGCRLLLPRRVTVRRPAHHRASPEGGIHVAAALPMGPSADGQLPPGNRPKTLLA